MKVFYLLSVLTLLSCEKKTCYTCTVTNAFSGTSNASSFNSVREFTECDKNTIRDVNNTYVKIDTTVGSVHITGLSHTNCLPN